MMGIIVITGQEQQDDSPVGEAVFGHQGLIKPINHASKCLLYSTVEAN